jgi:hypothetical protein
MYATGLTETSVQFVKLRSVAVHKTKYLTLTLSFIVYRTVFPPQIRADKASTEYNRVEKMGLFSCIVRYH